MLSHFTIEGIALQRLNSLPNVTHFLGVLRLESASKIMSFTTSLSCLLIAKTQTQFFQGHIGLRGKSTVSKRSKNFFLHTP